MESAKRAQKQKLEQQTFDVRPKVQPPAYRADSSAAQIRLKTARQLRHREQTKRALNYETPATNFLPPSGGDQGTTADQPARGSTSSTFLDISRALQRGQTGNKLTYPTILP